MSYTHSEVTRAFANRNPFNSRGNPLRGFSVYIDVSGDVIYSYGTHFPMAYADDKKKLFIVNGDRYSSSTSAHQNALRSAISGNTEYASVTIPFSVLRAANIESLWAKVLPDINVLDEGQEIDIAHCDTCGTDIDLNEWWEHGTLKGFRKEVRKNEHKKWRRHLLAPSLIRSGDRYFLSGFDETARAWNGGYFFTELPHKCKTIDEAFAMLRPEAVKRADAKNIEVKRQGDIFAIPTDVTTRKLHKKATKLPKHVMKVLLDWNNEPFAEEETEEFAEPTQIKYIKNGYRPRLLDTNHYATEAVSVVEHGKEVIYARGTLYHKPSWREADHRNITLGKVWHKIYRNTAVNSWSVSGRVD